MIEQAQELLRQVQHLLTEEGATQVVASSSWDDMLFEETVGAAPRLAEAIWALGQHTHYATDLYRDVFAYLWQQGPLVRARREMRRSRWANHVVLSTMAEDDGVAQLRRMCRHDAIATAEACVSLSESIRAWLKSVDADPQAQLAAAAADLAHALAAAEGAEGDGEGEGEEGEEGEEGAAAALAAATRALREAMKAAEEDQGGERPADAARARSVLSQALQEASAHLEEQGAARSAFGLGAGEVEHLPLGEQVRLGQQLQTTQLRDFHRLLGRLLGAAAAGPEVSAARMRPRGVELSGDVTRALPVELALMTTPGLQLDFLTRLADEEVLSTARSAPPARGPLVVVVDESGSMTEVGPVDERGRVIPRLVWAKALVLALARQMRAEGRALHIVSFASSNQQRVFGDSPQELITFAQHNFAGLTAIEPALMCAAGLIEADAAQHADVVLITDDDRLPPGARWLQAWKQRSQRWRTVGVSVGVPQGTALRAICERTVMVTDFTDAQAFARVAAMV